MKKSIVLIAGLVSISTMQGMQDPVKVFCNEIQGLNFNNFVKVDDIKAASTALQNLLATNNSRAVFLVPLGSKLVGLALSFVESDVCTKKEPNQGMWSTGALRSSYHDLLAFRKSIIDLLEDKRSLIWQERFASHAHQVNQLISLIQQLNIPESSWGTWAKSFITSSGEPYAQWSESYVGKGEQGQKASPFDNYLSEIYKFASNTNNDPVIRAIAHIYRLETQLLQYMIREKYGFKGPLVSKGQVALALTAAAVVGGAYVCGRYGGAQPANQ